MTSGLVSVSFRQLPATEIISLAKQAGLRGIEWGGDVHVPYGDLQIAESVGKATREAGLDVVAYGSYYRLGDSEGLQFETVADTAVFLSAPVIRVWAGRKGSADADETYWKAVCDDALRCADIAASRGLLIAYEYHSATLTDTLETTLRLLDATQHPAIRTLWQYIPGLSVEENLRHLRALLPWLQHIHAFYWLNDFFHRHPMSEGHADWVQYIRTIRETGKECPVLLEFVRDDDPSVLSGEAAALEKIFAEAWNCIAQKVSHRSAEI